jgi:hypothetical protein
MCKVVTKWQAEITSSIIAARIDTHAARGVAQGVHGQDVGENDGWEDLEDDFDTNRTL